MLKTALAISAASLLFVSNAVAQSGARACVTDVKSLCEDVKPGEGRIAACVKDHMKDLSEPCQNLLARAAAGQKSVYG